MKNHHQQIIQGSDVGRRARAPTTFKFNIKNDKNEIHKMIKV